MYLHYLAGSFREGFSLFDSVLNDTTKIELSVNYRESVETNINLEDEISRIVFNPNNVIRKYIYLYNPLMPLFDNSIRVRLFNSSDLITFKVKSSHAEAFLNSHLWISSILETLEDFEHGNELSRILSTLYEFQNETTESVSQDMTFRIGTDELQYEHYSKLLDLWHEHPIWLTQLMGSKNGNRIFLLDRDPTVSHEFVYRDELPKHYDLIHSTSLDIQKEEIKDVEALKRLMDHDHIQVILFKKDLPILVISRRSFISIHESYEKQLIESGSFMLLEKSRRL